MTHPTGWETFQAAAELHVAVRNPLGSEGTTPNSSLLGMIEKHSFQPHNILEAYVAFLHHSLELPNISDKSGGDGETAHSQCANTHFIKMF